MKAVNIENAYGVADNTPSFNNRDFNHESKTQWRDNLGFNIFNDKGIYTEEAKQFFADKNIQIKDGETPADAILRYAEFKELGYSVDKAITKRSDVKFSGSMILSSFLAAEEGGRQYREPKDNSSFEEGIDLDSMVEDDLNNQPKIKKKAIAIHERNETLAEMNARHRNVLNNL